MLAAIRIWGVPVSSPAPTNSREQALRADLRKVAAYRKGVWPWFMRQGHSHSCSIARQCGVPDGLGE